MKFIKALVGIALAGAFYISSTTMSHAIVVTWDLVDHGFGQLGPFYGLRLDDPLPTGPDRLFSFGGDSTASLVFDTAGTASINGTIIENGDGSTAACDTGNDDSPGDCSVWDLSYAFTGIVVQNAANPFAGFTATGGSGTVSLQSTSTELDLGFALNGNLSFLWLPDGHRLPGDNSSLVGRGWVDPTSYSSGANDFLFTGNLLVPEPGTLALFGIGLVGLGVMTRRRRKMA